MLQAPPPQAPQKAGGRSPYVYDSGDNTPEWASVLISGRSVSEQASCPNAAGLATVQMTVQDLPAAFANAPVICKYLPWRNLQGLKNATKQVNDHHMTI